MKLQVYHRTRYAYGAPVRDSFNEARLQPPDTDEQRRHSFILRVLPSARLTHYLDFYLNCVHMFEVNEPHSELVVEATSTVFTSDAPNYPEDATPTPLANLVGCARMDRCYDFLQASTYVNTGPEAWRLSLDASGEQSDAWQTALAVQRFVHREFTYLPASTHVHTTMDEVLRLRSGVCQDFAHVMLGLCRARHIPARYVSGYLYNGPADQLKGAQASHAWVEVFLPDLGWRGLDPTNNQQVNGHYVKVAVGRDYADVSPVKGTYRGTSDRKLTVEVLVTKLEDESAAIPPLADSRRA